MSIFIDPLFKIDYFLFVFLFDFMSYNLVLVHKLFIFSLQLFILLCQNLQLVRKFLYRYSLTFLCLKTLQQGLKLGK